MTPDQPTATATPRTCSRCGLQDPDEDHVFNMGGCIGALKAALAEAKAEVARYKDLAINGHLGSTVMAQVRAENAEADNAALRAEVERLKKVNPLDGNRSESGDEYLRRIANETESKPIIGGLKQ